MQEDIGLMEEVILPLHIEFFEMSSTVLAVETRIERYFQERGGLVVVLSDLNISIKEKVGEDRIKPMTPLAIIHKTYIVCEN